MEKLELKHLAPYLPYGLKVKSNLTGSILTLKGISYRGSLQNEEGFDMTNINRSKPILRPLSDLKKEIEVNGEKFFPFEYLQNNYPCFGFDYNNEEGFILKTDVVNYKYLPYMILYKLFEWNFDVFGLIDKGLALDINTL